MTLRNLKHETFEYLRKNYNTCEDDTTINGISRDIIRTMSQVYGKIYLAKINRYGDEKKNPVLVPYHGQRIYNSEYDVVVPKYDQDLIDLLLERERAEYTGTKADYVRVMAIMDRINALAGVNLFWA